MSNRRTVNAYLLGASTGLLAPSSTLFASETVKAIDCHAHVFTRDLPMPDRRRAPSGYDATLQTYLAQLDTHGMSHGVLVQPSFLGTDNSYLLASLQQQRQRLRGIAVISTDIQAQALDSMNSQGIVGIRLNLVGLPTPNFESPDWRRLLPVVKQLDWQVEVHREARLLQSVLDPLLAAGVKVVVDHFGRPDAALGIDDPGFRYLLSLGKTGQVWVKLSGAYRNGALGAGEATARNALPLLRAEYGLGRLVWGSDWPHTLFEGTQNYDKALATLLECLPDPADRAQVLWHTPRSLFRF